MAPAAGLATSTLRGFKTKVGCVPLNKIKPAFDSRFGGSTNQKHIETIITLLESNGGQLKDPVIVTKDFYQVTSRHGVEAAQQYYENLGVSPATEISVIILDVCWEGRSPEDEINLRLIAYDENARSEVKLANEQADTNMLVRRMVVSGMSDIQIKSRLGGNTLSPILNKAIKKARQSEVQQKRAEYIGLREQGITSSQARKQVGIAHVTAAKVEKSLVSGSTPDTRLRLHKLSEACNTMMGQWGRAADKAISTPGLSQEGRRDAYRAMEKVISRLQRKLATLKANIEDHIVNNADRIR